MDITVLWIDDEYKVQIDFISLAEMYGINIVPFESHEEGIMELEKNTSTYDAAILDAKVKKGKHDTVTNLEGLKESRDWLVQNGKIPFYIFTGQPDYQDNEIFEQSFGSFFTKGRDNDSLLEKIKSDVFTKDAFRLKKKYDKVLSLVDDPYLGEEYYDMLLGLLINLEGEGDATNVDSLTSVRKVIELLYSALHKKGVISNEIYTSNGKFSKSTKYLCFTLREAFSPVVSYALRTLSDLTQDGSHAGEGLRLKVDEHIRNFQTPFVFKSCCFLLLEILSWYKDFTINPGKYNPIPFVGIVEELSSRGRPSYYCGKYLLDRNAFIHNRLRTGERIEILESDENFLPNKREYPLYAKSFRRV